MLAKVRTFFLTRGIIEADPFLLSPYAPVIDVHIDPMQVTDGHESYYLHTSPEFGLKRLIARTGLDLYYLGHVFRSKELSRRHCPEFTMVEWYKNNTTEEDFFEEVREFLSLFIPKLPFAIYDYEELYTPWSQEFSIVKKDHPTWDSSTIKDYIFSEKIQPHLGKNEISIVTNFLEEEAALAKVENGKARRYEFFYQGLELGNGYHELTDTVTHIERMELNNQKRSAMGKSVLPIDPLFIKDLATYPLSEKAYGIAIGFDRLLMLYKKRTSLQEILPLPWPAP